MFRPTLSRPARAGAALVGVATMLGLAGCTAAAADTESSSTDDDATSTDSTTEATDSTESSESSESSDSTPSTSTYADGTYTATGSYITPESVEEITVTITLEDDVVTAVEVTGSPTNAESEQYQSQFIGGIAAEVVGQDVDSLDVDRVAGSSLTSDGFDAALATILEEAAA